MNPVANILRSECPELKIFNDVSFRELTSLGVGNGLLPLLVEPESEEQLVDVLKILHKKEIRTFLFGAGTNLVGCDEPGDLVGLRLSGKHFSRVAIDGLNVRVGAYARLPLLASLCGKAGLGGLAPLSGIPGSIGGALRMNAGANGVEIGRFVSEIRGFYPDGRKYQAGKDDIQWFYRGNTIPKEVIITEAVLTLTESNVVLEEEEICLETERRRKREPAGRTAGCAFRNVSDLDPAGKLIDMCGLRGLRVGDLIVSEKHANYIMNLGSASEKDYLDLVRILRRAVAGKHGFYLIPEIIPVNEDLARLISEDTPAPKVNLLCGGVSSEREVSLKSGSAVAKALRNAGFKVENSDIRSCELTPEMQACDVVYPVLHGGFGEDGTLQRMLEDARIRFVGSGSAASRLVMDKIATKKLLDRIALPTAPWAVVTRQNRKFPENLKFPVMIKAPFEGSTVGIVKVDAMENWESALDEEFKYSDELLVEEFVKGVEITVPVINAGVLEAIEIVSPTGFYDWDAKYVYNNGETQYIIPPKSLPENVIRLAKEYALKFYHASGCRDILRVDFIIDSDGVPRILEGNNLPGNTDHSLVPKAARHAGVSMERMCALMVYCAMKRSGDVPVVVADKIPDKKAGVFDRFISTLCNLAAFCAGIILIYAGVMRSEWGSKATTMLLAGGILTVIFAFCRQFDRRGNR
ncbi:MAG: D-alanine--D-alanine ligase [Lentisphaerae bacterium]|nr:D-alanine--D-alanine ligase [Lentisphaerota bacterium]